jgi:hypothetical protein
MKLNHCPDSDLKLRTGPQTRPYAAATVRTASSFPRNKVSSNARSLTLMFIQSLGYEYVEHILYAPYTI